LNFQTRNLTMRGIDREFDLPLTDYASDISSESLPIAGVAPPRRGDGVLTPELRQRRAALETMPGELTEGVGLPTDALRLLAFYGLITDDQERAAVEYCQLRWAIYDRPIGPALCVTARWPAASDPHKSVLFRRERYRYDPRKVAKLVAASRAAPTDEKFLRAYDNSRLGTRQMIANAWLRGSSAEMRDRHPIRSHTACINLLPSERHGVPATEGQNSRPVYIRDEQDAPDLDLEWVGDPGPAGVERRYNEYQRTLAKQGRLVQRLVEDIVLYGLAPEWLCDHILSAQKQGKRPADIPLPPDGQLTLRGFKALGDCLDGKVAPKAEKRDAKPIPGSRLAERLAVYRHLETGSAKPRDISSEDYGQYRRDFDSLSAGGAR
jgi:hypothetical protein